jgi:hypothetical protein
MMYRHLTGVVAAVLLACPLFARAQFIGGQAALFEPEIDVVSSGVLLDVQGTVSADRKYVTLNMRPSQSQLLNLFTFEFQRGTGVVQVPAGFVGGVNPVIAGPQGAVIPDRPNAPMRLIPGNGGAILLTRGITPLIAR